MDNFCSHQMLRFSASLKINKSIILSTPLLLPGTQMFLSCFLSNRYWYKLDTLPIDLHYPIDVSHTVYFY